MMSPIREQPKLQQAGAGVDTRLTATSELAATIAHEVRQALCGMTIRAQTGVRWCDHPNPDIARLKATFERIAADGLRAGAVIESIRSNFRKDVQSRAAVDVNDLIADVLAFAQDDIRKHNITVHAERNAGLPKIAGDRIQLQQVLLNLIANAIEAMTATDHPILRVGCELRHRTMTVSVEDCGTGVGAQDRERIFQPLFTTKPNGMGMGLSICRSIIESHGGRLWTSPRQPRGSVFHFSLPCDP